MESMERAVEQIVELDSKGVENKPGDQKRQKALA
jgi:hypothetical protein